MDGIALSVSGHKVDRVLQPRDEITTGWIERDFDPVELNGDRLRKCLARAAVVHRDTQPAVADFHVLRNAELDVRGTAVVGLHSRLHQ